MYDPPRSCGCLGDNPGDRGGDDGAVGSVTCDNVIHGLWTKESVEYLFPFTLASPPRRLIRWQSVGMSASSAILRAGGHEVEVRRSSRRRRTVSAYREGDRFVVLVPARMSAANVATYVDELVGRLQERERRATPSDEALLKRAATLSRAWLPTAPQPTSVRWVTNQRQRWGSCTPADGTIRHSHRLQGMPQYVIDYVLLHELAHLLVAGHGADFELLLAPYSRLAEARSFLDGVSFATAHGADTWLCDSVDDEAVDSAGPPPGLLF